jgi:very-short-patch-repair endonuclease
LGKFVFDLAFIDKRLFVEFDGPYHGWTEQIESDKSKDGYAQSMGWKVIRLSVEKNSIIDASLLIGVI